MHILRHMSDLFNFFPECNWLIMKEFMINAHLSQEVNWGKRKLLVEHELIRLTPDIHNEMCVCEENTIAVSSKSSISERALY